MQKHLAALRKVSGSRSGPPKECWGGLQKLALTFRWASRDHNFTSVGQSAAPCGHATAHPVRPAASIKPAPHPHAFPAPRPCTSTACSSQTRAARVFPALAPQANSRAHGAEAIMGRLLAGDVVPSGATGREMLKTADERLVGRRMQALWASEADSLADKVL